MPYTKEDGGRLNNFASEPKVYKAEPPTKTQKMLYFVAGVGAIVLVAGLIYVTILVSNPT